MPLLVAGTRHYIVETTKLFVSYKSEGCSLLPEKVLDHQEISQAPRNEGRSVQRPNVETKRKIKLDGRLRLPFVTAAARLQDSTKGEEPFIEPAILLAVARYVANGWEISAVETNGIFARSKALAGRLLSGATDLSEPIGTFRFDAGKKKASIYFEVRLPRGG